jgi:2-amino-4-hydroxy-6-hydroxymethyldihydropteridine diphosphokinase
MSPTVRAYIGLGSNLEDPAHQLRSAIDALAQLPVTRVLRHSRLFRTPPWGREDQPSFVNAVAELETGLSANDLLRGLQQIEQRAGRDRVLKWGPRILDLDLLLYADQRISDGILQVPHRHMHERAFVLVPLAELAPALVIPGVEGSVAELLAAVDCSGIEALG